MAGGSLTTLSTGAPGRQSTCDEVLSPVVCPTSEPDGTRPHPARLAARRPNVSTTASATRLLSGSGTTYSPSRDWLTRCGGSRSCHGAAACARVWLWHPSTLWSVSSSIWSLVDDRA